VPNVVIHKCRNSSASRSCTAFISHFIRDWLEFFRENMGV